ncbi:hypothetical protein WA538_001739 [Blastocystis sp. DL]
MFQCGRLVGRILRTASLSPRISILPLLRSMTTATIPAGYKTITEGSATILFPENNDVFYNKVQVKNRDLSILMITLFGQIQKEEMEALKAKKPKRYEGLLAERKKVAEAEGKPWMAEDGLYILEALAASGLRSIRYFQEIPNIRRLIVNDIADAAVASMKQNFAFNHLTSDRIVANQADATMLMYANRSPSHRFDVIDLDPYGSCSIFLDGAVQSLRDGGLLCVTSTDLTVLCGNHPEVAYSKYGSNCPKTVFCHELAVRILLHTIKLAAAKYGRNVEVLAAFQIDFYVRCFVRIWDSRSDVKRLASESSLLHYCPNCHNYQLQPLGREKGGKFSAPGCVVDSKCNVCGGVYKLGGPIYAGELHDHDFVKRAIDLLDAQFVSKSSEPLPNFKCSTHGILLGMLTAMQEEIAMPLYFSFHGVASALRLTAPKYQEIASALRNAGFATSQCHCDPLALKTNAPGEVVFDVFRAYFRKFQLAEKQEWLEKLPEGFAKQYLSQPATREYDFTLVPELKKEYTFPRFPGNPEANWGPKARGSLKRSNIQQDNYSVCCQNWF